MYSDTDKINSTGVNLNLLAYGWDRDFGRSFNAIRCRGGEVLAVTGAMMAVKREVFDRIGLLDSRFFAYFEDVDFCIRVWKYTNLTVNYVPKSIVYHKFSASSGRLSSRKMRLMTESQYRLFFKHYPVWIIIMLFPVLVLCHLVQNRSNPSALSYEIITAIRQLILLPGLVLRRTHDFFRKNASRPERFWDKVVKEIGLPKISFQD